jgi:uncharacterized protein (TIRG00374 family)
MDQPMAKSILVFFIKVGIAAALIFWLFKTNRLDLSVIKDLSCNKNTVFIFATGAISVFCGILLISYRIWLILRFKRFAITYKTAICVTLMGSFWSVVLPGLAGGDAMKAIYLCSNVSERRMDSLTSVVIDRFFGLFSLLLLGTLVYCIAYAVQSMPSDFKFFWLPPSVFILSCLMVIITAWNRFFHSHSFQAFFLLLPQKIQIFLISLRSYLKSPKLVFISIILSLLNHALVVVSFISAAILLQLDIPIFSHFIFDPLAMLLNAMPITPGGIGIAESGFSLLFQSQGFPNGAIMGLLGRLIQYSVFVATGGVALSLLRVRHSIRVMDPTPNIS